MTDDTGLLDPALGDPPAGDPPAPNGGGDPPAGDPPAGDPPAGDPPPSFKLPEDFDWRTHFAGGDEKLLKLAGRYQSPKALLEGTAQLRAKLSSGKVIEPLGDDATDEEKAAFRKALNVPDAAADYEKSLPEGYVLGDDDKPRAQLLFDKMHAVNASPAAVNAALEVHQHLIEEQQAALADADAEAKDRAIEEMRDEWGADYKRNLNVAKSYLDTLPEPVANALKNGRGPDGMALANNPAIIRWLTAQALEANPLATVVPGAGANQASAIADEIASIKKQMGTPAYAKNEPLQARYRELLAAQEKLPK